MIILGLQIEHDGTAAVVDGEGRVLAAVGEERLSRVKNHWGFPFRAIAECLRIAGISARDVDVVAIGGTEAAAAYVTRASFSRANDGRLDVFRAPLPMGVRTGLLFSAVTGGLLRSPESVERDRGDLRLKLVHRALRDLGLDRAPVTLVDHHHAHAASAYFTSGWDRCLAVTMDQYGDGLCATASECRDGKIHRLSGSGDIFSPGVFYTEITRFLGFRRHRHEGKITGLAAYGDPSVCIDRLRPCLTLDPAHLDRFAPAFDDMARDAGYHRRLDEAWRLIAKGEPTGLNLYALQRYFEATLRGVAPKDVAAAAQRVLEEFATAYVALFVKDAAAARIALGGGTFANVRVNQRIREIPGVADVFVHPHMTDGGLAVGAALSVAADAKAAQGDALRPRRLDHVFFGPDPSAAEIEQAVRRSGFPAVFVPESERRIAAMIHGGLIVGRVDGAMEYGPRALGNRSILVRPTDRTVNDWLNKRLHRTEFMPFAPAMLAEDGPRVFASVSGLEYAAEFMTVTMDVRPEWHDRAPAVVHVDGTARPQFVTPRSNPKFYEIIREYARLSGLPMLINTSFNIHEEPIICTAEDGVKGLRDGAVDVLALGDWFVARNRSLIEARAPAAV